MNKRRRVDSREVGLEIAMIFGEHFLKTKHLHYGYWTDDLKVDLRNVHQAQENYVNFVISHIPEGTQTILDVGCGAGRFALKLIERGYQVDCVSPSPLLTERARDLLGSKSRFFECGFEELQTDHRYDLVLFSESFQYVNLEKGLQTALNCLHDGGYLLICDFFKTEAEGGSIFGGGHGLVRFYDVVSQYPLRPIENIDITKETAPNLELVNDFLVDVGLPTRNLLVYFMKNNYPFFYKFLQWKYRTKMEKINRKYFSGARNADNFARLKSYRLLLYKKDGGAAYQSLTRSNAE